KLTHINT
ncbi:malonyl-CoA O-methyltransferase BioC, partial [Vibrio parahaemolyticus EKP-021]